MDMPSSREGDAWSTCFPEWPADEFMEDQNDLPNQCQLIPLTENDLWEECARQGSIKMADPVLLRENASPAKASVKEPDHATIRSATGEADPESTLDPALGQDLRKNEDFYHSPMDDSSGQIRLLHLLPDQYNQIQGSIQVFDRDLAPPYIAISYTWGTSPQTEAAILNSQPFQISESCQYALQQVQSCQTHRDIQVFELETAHHVWIDAICINQADLDEKSQQVARMGETFASAAAVFACVGQHDSGSGEIFELASNPATQDSASAGSGLLDAMSMKETQWKQCEGLWKANQLQDLLRALRAFGERDYFHRLWVVQELLVAVRVILLCGDSHIHYDALSCLSFCAASTWTHYTGKRWPIYSTSGIFHRILSFGELTNTTTSWDLPSAIETFRHARCTDPRDRVYGLLRLIEWRHQAKPLVPDYRKSRLQVATDVLLLIHEHHGFERAGYLLQALELFSDSQEVLSLRRERLEVFNARAFPSATDGAIEPTRRQHFMHDSVYQCVPVFTDNDGRLVAQDLKASQNSTSTRSLHSAITLEMIQSQGLIEIRSDSSVLGYACPGTQSGDYLVQMSYLQWDSAPNGMIIWLVLRDTPEKDDIFEIVGHALIDAQAVGSDVQLPRVSFVFDCEDFITLTTRFRFRLDEDFDRGIDPECLIASVTRSRLSSYAIRTHSRKHVESSSEGPKP